MFGATPTQYLNGVKKTPEFVSNYRRWCEERPLEKWPDNELPKSNFVLSKIKEQKSLFCPGPAAASKRYLNFLRGLKNINGIVLDKLYSFNNQYLCQNV